MGALTSNRKRVDDYYRSSTSFSPPIDLQLYGHISKKPKISFSASQNTAEYSRSTSSRSVVSIVSAYPDTKSSFSRVPHAPVRNLRFRPFTLTKKFETRAGGEESSPKKMGNCLGIHDLYKDVKKKALGTLSYYRKVHGVFVEKEKVNEVIEIDDDDEEEEMHDVSDDSSIEEVDIVEGKDGHRDLENLQGLNCKMKEKEIQSLHSSLVSDVSNADGKVYAEKTGWTLLDHKKDDMVTPLYKQLHASAKAKKRDGKLSNINFDIELSEKRLQGHYYLRSQTKGQVKKDWVEECFVPLTEEEEEEVSNALSYSNRRKVMVSHAHSNIDITGEKLQCLKPGGWLNDEVINVYLDLLKEREKREPEKFLKCHFFNTFFYKKLIGGKGGYDFKSVGRWTTQRKLGYSLSECDKIFVPIHQQVHWCVAIINKKEEKIQYLDSLKGVDSQVLVVLAKYYVDEVKEKSGKEIDVSSWEFEYVRDLPEQENGYDCGMFMIKYADFYSRDLGLCFRQEHMPYFRKRTAKELLRLRAD